MGKPIVRRYQIKIFVQWRRYFWRKGCGGRGGESGEELRPVIRWDYVSPFCCKYTDYGNSIRVYLCIFGSVHRLFTSRSHLLYRISPFSVCQSSFPHLSSHSSSPFQSLLLLLLLFLLLLLLYFDFGRVDKAKRTEELYDVNRSR